MELTTRVTKTSINLNTWAQNTRKQTIKKLYNKTYCYRHVWSHAVYIQEINRLGISLDNALMCTALGGDHNKDV